MVNEDYDQVLRNNDRSMFLGSKNQNKLTKNDANTRSIPTGPIMRDEQEIRNHTE